MRAIDSSKNQPNRPSSRGLKFGRDQRLISAQVVGLVSAIAATYYFIVGLVPVCLWLVSLPGTWLGSLFGARLADSFGSRNVLIFFVAFLCLEVVYNVCVLTELPIFDSISSLNR